MTISVEDRRELTNLLNGFEASTIAEQALYDALKRYRDAFVESDGSDATMRQVRIAVDAKSVADRSRKSANALRATLDALENAQRWEVAMRNIATIMVGSRSEFDLNVVVEAVRALKNGRDTLLEFVEDYRPDISEIEPQHVASVSNMVDIACVEIADKILGR